MSARMVILGGLLILVLAPLAGGMWRGLPPAFGEFPPATQYIDHADFSPAVFAFLALFEMGLAALWIQRARSGSRTAATTPARPLHAFPRWGLAGIALVGALWPLAWARFDALGRWNDYTFFPLWLGYILTMDGLVCRRTGSSLLRRDPLTFLTLFPASAIVWWYFEYLNRFVQNWHYHGADYFGAAHYAILATLCFSTVLPAVFETREWLESFPRLHRVCDVLPRGVVMSRRGTVIILAAGAAGLVALARFPNPTFFLVWLAPLAVLGGTLSLAGTPTPFSDLQEGRGRPLLTLALAALFCGLFWEMWNFYSLPKWTYTVPYVQKVLVFEMPLLGFAGYLPFGPLCGCFWLALRALVNPRAHC